MTNKRAIEMLTNMRNNYDAYGQLTGKDEITQMLDMAIKALEERKGKWILTKRNGILCGVCHSGLRRMPTLGGKPMFVYCPFCGAKMEWSEEE